MGDVEVVSPGFGRKFSIGVPGDGMTEGTGLAFECSVLAGPGRDASCGLTVAGGRGGFALGIGVSSSSRCVLGEGGLVPLWFGWDDVVVL